MNIPPPWRQNEYPLTCSSKYRFFYLFRVETCCRTGSPEDYRLSNVTSQPPFSSPKSGKMRENMFFLVKGAEDRCWDEGRKAIMFCERYPDGGCLEAKMRYWCWTLTGPGDESARGARVLGLLTFSARVLKPRQNAFTPRGSYPERYHKRAKFNLAEYAWQRDPNDISITIWTQSLIMGTLRYKWILL